MCRSTASDLAVDRRILEHDDRDIESNVELIAEEFRMGFEAVDRIPRPAANQSRMPQRQIPTEA